MTDFELSTPVALLVFNRPDTTARVFEEIRQARPPKLLVVADGPRWGRTDDIEKCAAVRRIIAAGVDWNCEVLTNYSEPNLGCKRRVSSGLDWVFHTVPEAIVLEDDCLPHPTFFRYCQELLERYREDKRVMHVSGVNLLFDKQKIDNSYYFTRYAHVWGWASWRRAWQHYDVELSTWLNVRKNGVLKGMMKTQDSRDWGKIFDLVSDGHIDTWDYQWVFAIWLQKALCVNPSVNLVSNIGFGSGATHTTDSNTTTDMSIEAMQFPLRHPEEMIRNDTADDYVQRIYFKSPSLYRRISNKMRKVARRLMRNS